MPLVLIEEDLGEMRRHLFRDYAMLARYGHQPITEAARLTGRERRAMIQALMDLVDEENEIARQSAEERD